MPILQCDTIRSLVLTINIGLIKDEANVEAPRRGPRVEMHLLSENLVDIVELA